MEILGQQWWVQLVGLTISLGGLYFYVTGVWMLLKAYEPMVEAMRDAIQSQIKENKDSD